MRFKLLTPRFRFVIVLAAVTLLPAPASVVGRPFQEPAADWEVLGSNLIPNPSLEEASQESPQIPAGWQQNIWSGQPQFEVERGFAHSGRCCLKIQSGQGADASWSIPLKLKQNATYRLSAWIKTENVGAAGLGALLNLHQLQMEGKSEALRGTHDWQQVVTQFHTGTHDRLLVNLLFGGWGQATGTAWFDDLELVELRKPAEPVLSEDEALMLFESRVLPILKQHCFSCHGQGDKIRGELVLTNREDLIAGGESGPAIDLQSPADSLLLEAVNYDSYEMPPDGKLPTDDIRAIRQWVLAGAPWKGEGFKPDVDVDHSGVPQVNEETKRWWSYQTVVRPPLPAVASSANPIDQFVAAKLTEHGLSVSKPADRRTLIRRVHYDLTGLPPTPAEVAEFENDESPDAYAQLVDRLLESPHYGEKWGRHWLDVVRYAESNSYERDGTKPFVWRYRDYVIRSFNEDKPYDLFLMEQLAGDEMDEVTAERIIATGYYRLGLWDDEPADPQQAWYDDMDDVLATTAQGMLGMTLNCARCHDHKIDPVPQEDYYRMLAFFRNIRRYGVRAHQTVEDASVRVIAPPAAREEYRAQMQEYRDQVQQNRQAMEAIEAIVRTDFMPVEHEDFKSEMNRVPLVTQRAGGVITEDQAQQYQALFNEMRRLRGARPAALESALCVKETGVQPLPTHVLVRGNAHVPGKAVEPGFPSVLSPADPLITPPNSGNSTGRRLALARWIVDPANPLTARVMVNRIWQHHFGRGIVRSSSDFGFQGTLPTHPLLLDWLASEFVAADWSIKAMHRLIMNSQTYQQSSAFDALAYEKDPVNDLFWRFDGRRLTAEEIRDSILAVNGSLNLETLYGPSIYPIIPDEVLQGQSVPGADWGDSSPEERNRRSVYIHVKRSLPVPMLSIFDVADPDTACPVRFNTVQPTQALGMINSDFMKWQSTAFAESIAREVPQDIPGQVRATLLRVLQRIPSETEVQRGVDFIRAVQSEDQRDRQEALRQFCLITLNLNEFMFLD